jgi:hypothetical protein
MRLHEIKSQNLLILQLSNLDIEFDIEYNFVIETHSFMKEKNVGSARHRPILNNINDLELRINTFLNIKFFPDRDINDIRLKVRKYLKNLEIIKKQIP